MNKPTDWAMGKAKEYQTLYMMGHNFPVEALASRLDDARKDGAKAMQNRIVAFLDSIINKHPELCYAADDADYGFDEPKVIEAVFNLTTEDIYE